MIGIYVPAAVAANIRTMKMTSGSHLKLFSREIITDLITQMKFSTDLYIIVIKRCACGLIRNCRENKNIQYGARQPSCIV